ncbi:Brp/Blh family beta-carotene 15,15'-dioxygenase [Stieleria sp. ICT_E10.1]|uniref:Brp/Blh family beta-carotene 15,15'-dioxygenase n=1 Tax=Stieleria sedimenti TaxID=2976331 RepID=UPI00217FD0FA|nr:Brp/Blh family beta-carotene 15,15'-dioxygenase [Stieleria sedimenti]MCS7468055.1 Brp/Blh family beta-carotene 15,15'-dioxygenase [Stieleria sedimenti]
MPTTVTLAGLVVAVSLVGIPHGGLDHWTGRRLLGNRFPRTWAMIFFPSYVAVALVVALGWWVIPLATVVAFSLVSAWHFGIEDEQVMGRSSVLNHLLAIAVGGLVIWIPVLTQPDRVGSLLGSIVPPELILSTGTIVWTTRWIAAALLPLAVSAILRGLMTHEHRGRAARNLCFALMFLTADVLVSFGIYFCGWHSIRGLRGLTTTHRRSLPQVLLATTPLSVAAIVLSVIGMWFWSSGQFLSDAVARTLFIGLSAIAVPHLLLHGPISRWVGTSAGVSTVGASSSSGNVEVAR